MKSFALAPTVGFLIALVSPASAGDIEIDATVGYRFGGAVETELQQGTLGDVTGRLTVDSAPSFGGILGYRIQSNGSVFVSYSRQQTAFRFRTDVVDAGVVESTGSIEYIQFGGNLLAERGRATPYIGFSVGVGRFASFDTGGDAYRFSAVIDGGIKFEILPFLHARFLGRVPMTFSGGELYCFTGYGCAAIVGSAPLVQGEVQAGLGVSF